MTTIPAQPDPPQWMQVAVSYLLPPASREHVLGDLQERFGERDARARWIGYVGDVVTTVPHVLRSQFRRIVTRSSPHAKVGDLRSRAEQFQTQVWFRNAVMLAMSAFLLVVLRLNTRTGWSYNDIVSVAMTIGWIGAAWQAYSVRGSTMVPASLSLDELRVFHRRELLRQAGLGVGAFIYWSVPSVLLILYALVDGVPGFSGGKPASLLGAVAVQTCAVAWGHRMERRRCQRELDLLDREADRA